MPPSIRALALVALAALPASALGAPPRGFTHEKSIFADAADVSLRNPEGVACDDRGALVVADTGNARLLTYTWRDGSLDGGTQVRVPQLPYPVRLQIDSKGFVYVLDRKARRIGKVDAKGAFAGYVDPKGAGGTVTPVAFKLDAADNVYLLDVSGARVLVLSPEGKVTRELPLPAGVRAVTDVAAESGGRIYVVDAPSATLYVAEPQEKGFKPLTASMKDVLGFPGYLVADNRGKLWVVDQNGGAVVRLGNDGSFQGRELALGWSDGALLYPGQVCVTAAGEVFVADRNNNRVQIFAMPR